MSPLNKISLRIQDPQTPNIVLFFWILRRVLYRQRYHLMPLKFCIVIKSVWTVFYLYFLRSTMFFSQLRQYCFKIS